MALAEAEANVGRGEAGTIREGSRAEHSASASPSALPALRSTLRALARLWAAALVLWRAVFSPLLSTAIAITFLLGCTLYLFRDALVDSLIYSRSDTVTYYYPIAARLTDVLREGRLILWTRHIFGGFPLFADGEAGMLYPPNLVAYLLLPEVEAFIWLRVVRYFLAATFTYAYLRSMRLNGFAASVGALTYTFGSFMVIQMHHTNVGNTALWLPLTLCMIELAVRNVGRWRWLYATGAGTSVGIQTLGLHIQPLLLSGLFLAIYIPFRVMLCPIAWPRPKKKRQPAPPDSPHLAAAAHLLMLAKPDLGLPQERRRPRWRLAAPPVRSWVGGAARCGLAVAGGAWAAVVGSASGLWWLAGRVGLAARAGARTGSAGLAFGLRWSSGRVRLAARAGAADSCARCGWRWWGPTCWSGAGGRMYGARRVR